MKTDNEDAEELRQVIRNCDDSFSLQQMALDYFEGGLIQHEENMRLQDRIKVLETAVRDVAHRLRATGNNGGPNYTLTLASKLESVLPL